MRLAFSPYELKFRFPAGTSRGVLLHKKTYFLKYYDESQPGKPGYGEAAVFAGLSAEDGPQYENKLIELSRNIRTGKPTDIKDFSSIIFGLEQAQADFLNGGKGVYFDSPFIRGEISIRINGLIWMGNRNEMVKRVEKKISEGYGCIKVKIGAIAWEDELYLLSLIRELTEDRNVDLRVDANGAFDSENCMSRLKDLEKFRLHSIEQPVKPGQWDLLRKLCENTPVPIALDEELIGINEDSKRLELLTYVRPRYIVLKPALCYGFSGAASWIEAADKNGVGWWITSALESSVGLDAIAQFTATKQIQMAQGLGTGNLYTNNFKSPLTLSGDKLRLTERTDIFQPKLETLEWKEY